MADSPRSLVRVVVPVYRELTPDEESSLRNNVRVLAAWPFTVLHPRGVTPPACCRELGLETRAVGDEWLGRRNGIAGYNRMMLSEEFYASFPDTEYILICHTDAWIFRDELGDWCRRGYDCVASAAALRSAAGQTVYAVEGADETSPGRGFAAGALRPRRQRRVVAAPCGGVPAGLCDLPHGGRELPRRSLPSP